MRLKINHFRQKHTHTCAPTGPHATCSPLSLGTWVHARSPVFGCTVWSPWHAPPRHGHDCAAHKLHVSRNHTPQTHTRHDHALGDTTDHHPSASQKPPTSRDPVRGPQTAAPHQKWQRARATCHNVSAFLYCLCAFSYPLLPDGWSSPDELRPMSPPCSDIA